jgi:serpin B
MPKPITFEKNQKQLIDADNRLGFDIYRNILKKEDQRNILLSPLGLNKLLSLLSYGTKDNYRIKRMLNLPKLADGAFLGEINTLNKTLFQLDDFCKFTTSDMFVLHDLNGINDTFSKFFRENKGVNLQNNSLNYLSSNTLGVKSFDVQNDIYLKCNFKYQTGTTESPFYLNPNESKFVEMLICESDFNYYSDNILKAVEIPIGRGNFNALVIMPETGQTVESLKSKFNSYYLKAINNRFRKLNLSVYMPQLDIDYTCSFTENMQKTVFNRTLNNLAFEKINDKKLFLHDFLQSVKLKTISKPGSNGMVSSKKPNSSIFIDRPFLFLITEKYSGSLVFIGQIANPTSN